jgi:hypothetical protein
VPWLTYAQIGERFGLAAEAARTRVRRLGWRTQPGNDGRTLVLVPDEADLRPGGDRVARPAGDHPSDRAETGLLTGLLTAAEGRAERAEQRTEEASRRADNALALADRLGAMLGDEGARARRAEARADEAHAEAEKARERAERVEQAEAARRAKRRLRRVWEAWRGV